MEYELTKVGDEAIEHLHDVAKKGFIGERDRYASSKLSYLDRYKEHRIDSEMLLFR